MWCFEYSWLSISVISIGLAPLSHEGMAHPPYNPVLLAPISAAFGWDDVYDGMWLHCPSQYDLRLKHRNMTPFLCILFHLLNHSRHVGIKFFSLPRKNEESLLVIYKWMSKRFERLQTRNVKFHLTFQSHSQNQATSVLPKKNISRCFHGVWLVYYTGATNRMGFISLASNMCQSM